MKIKLPVLVINMKEYDDVLGNKALDIAKTAKQITKKNKITILVSPPPLIFSRIAKIVPSVSQHIDAVQPGAFTGAVLAKEVKLVGGVGSLINHSEKRIPKKDIKKTVELCKEYSLISIVCAKDSKEAGELAKYKPDFIAVEPPELIGGDVSVSTAKPEIIKKTVKSVRKASPRTKVLCGAGVKTSEDVKKSIELGAKGVLVASGVVKAKNVRASIEDLIKGMK